MIDCEKMKKFANAVLKVGVNLQKGQGLELSCPVEKYREAEIFTEVAYSLGASVVKIRWNDERVDKHFFLNADKKYLSAIPAFEVAAKNYLIKENFCYVAIAAEDPDALDGVPEENVALYSRARAKALKKYSDQIMVNRIRWCVVSLPTEKWAEKVFKDSDDAMGDLENAIIKTMRLDGDNAVKAWDEHIKLLDRRADYLNKKNFKFLHYENSLGTNFTVGLADNHFWLSAKEKAADGVEFVANMPTEEVFTAPHKGLADGVVKAAMPLVYDGKTVDGFSLTFKKGKIVDFSAKTGYDVLKRIIETDAGTRRLGEVALIGKNSPIAKSGILFYNTLFDENASCHLALGKAYPTTVKGGDKLTKKELSMLGVNDSKEHVDFMIGTPDLKITGITENGECTTIFSDGDWVI